MRGDFAGRDLGGIRLNYNGSAGGTPFDLDDAIDGSGNHVSLPGASFVRIDVLQGVSEIDALSVVVPEPAASLLVAVGAGLFWMTRRRK